MSNPEDQLPPHPVLTDYYASEEDRKQCLTDLFNASARHYDRVLRYGFLGMGGHYRLRALKQAGLKADMRLLDVACGTGGILWQARKVVAENQLVGVDPSEGMLAEARNKLPGVELHHAPAEALPCPDEAFDFVVMGYALRHVRTLEEAFIEYARVLKPGGKVLLLEISRPRSKIGYWLARAYLKYFIPEMAGILCRDREARRMMRYFWDSIDACVSQEKILDALARSGFTNCRNDSSLGMFSAYSGVKCSKC